MENKLQQKSQLKEYETGEFETILFFYHTNIPEWLVGVINCSLHLAGPGVKLVLPPVPKLVQQVSRIPPEAAEP